jgi:AraC-like DNA-binding protein
MSGVITTRTVLAADGVRVDDVRCRHAPGPGGEAEPTDGHALVFVRRGCFVRRARAGTAVLDATLAYTVGPGEEERYDHPHAGGDDCTALRLDPRLLASLWGGEPGLPAGPLPVSAALDLEHRRLLAAARRGGDRHELVEHAVLVAASALAAADPGRVAAGRPPTARARRELADAARQILAAEPGLPLPALARRLAVSPHHLSRVFRTVTGHTVSAHRRRLRARVALERLAGGERDLARLAADAGFADQSHLTRVLRAQTRHTPGALRALLAG